MNKSVQNQLVPDHSFRLTSESDIINAFRDKDHGKVILPDNVRYPVDVKHYYSWQDSSGVYMYLLFKKPKWKAPAGFVFRRVTGGVQPQTSRICNWCHCSGSSDQIGTMSMTVNSKTSVGIILCKDLSCIRKIEEVSELSGRRFEKALAGLYERMGNFCDTMIKVES